MELPRNVLDPRVRVALHLDRHEGRHLADKKAHEVERAPGAGYLNLSIETAHGDRAVVVLEQTQFHALFSAHIVASVLDHVVEVRRVYLGESGVDVEGAIVPPSASGAVADPIGGHVLVVDFEPCRVSATSNDSSQRPTTEVQVEIVIAQPNIEPCSPACSQDDSTWAMKEVVKERVRQTSPEVPTHLLVPVVASM